MCVCVCVCMYVCVCVFVCLFVCLCVGGKELNYKPSTEICLCLVRTLHQDGESSEEVDGTFQLETCRHHHFHGRHLADCGESRENRTDKARHYSGSLSQFYSRKIAHLGNEA